MKSKLVLVNIPDIEESGIYMIDTVAGIEIVFQIEIEREYKTYQHDYDTPPEDILDYEYIECNLLSAHTKEGDFHDIPPEIQQGMEQQLIYLIKQNR